MLVSVQLQVSRALYSFVSGGINSTTVFRQQWAANQVTVVEAIALLSQVAVKKCF